MYFHLASPGIFTNFVILGELLNLSEPYFQHYNKTYLGRLFGIRGNYNNSYSSESLLSSYYAWYYGQYLIFSYFIESSHNSVTWELWLSRFYRLGNRFEEFSAWPSRYSSYDHNYSMSCEGHRAGEFSEGSGKTSWTRSHLQMGWLFFFFFGFVSFSL